MLFPQMGSLILMGVVCRLIGDSIICFFSFKIKNKNVLLCMMDFKVVPVRASMVGVL